MENLENTEVVEETTQVEEVTELEEKPKKTVEELEAELEALRKKNEGAEEVAKKLKDEKSQAKRQELEFAKQQEIQQAKQEFMVNTLEEAMNGEGLTEEHFKQAEANGISAEQLELALYKSRERVNQIYEKAGGKDRYFEMVEVVKSNVDEDTKQAFKELLSNPKTSDIALEALESRYNKLANNGDNNQSTDNRIVAKNTAEGTVSIYKSMQEYQADIRKMRTLPSTRQGDFYKQIQAKLDRSKLV